MFIWIFLIAFAVGNGSPVPEGEEFRGRRLGWVANNYNFPFICTITSSVHSVFASTCTIATEHFVIASSDSLFATWDDEPFYYKPHLLKVWGGSMFMNPQIARIQEDYRKEIEVKKIHFSPYKPIAWADNLQPGKDGYVDFSGLSLISVNKSFSTQFDKKALTDDIKWNVIGGMEIGVCVVQLKMHRTWWSSYILPIPLPVEHHDDWDGLMKEALKWVDDLEANPQGQTACYASSWNRSNKTMDINSVMYVSRKSCREMYCSLDRKTCLQFPSKEFLICFRSLTYIDLCPEDRGSAVYCPSFSGSVVAILTTASNCGENDLPNVYTLIPIPMLMINGAKATGREYHIRLERYENMHRLLAKYRVSPPPSTSTTKPGFEED